MTDQSILYALIAGIGLTLISGPLGCFVIWRRMAYFGDSLAHSALLGVALGMLYGFSTTIGIVIICFLFALLLVWLQHKHVLATDTLLGILAHASLSLGMVAISFTQNKDFELHDYLFGDILAVGLNDIYWVYGGGLVVVMLLIANWSSLTLMTINQELAKAEGVNSFWLNLLLMLLMTIVVAVSIRIVGILLITSMLIIPTATARQFSKSPESMAIISAFLGIISVILGITFATIYDSPTGPSIVSIATMMFIILLPFALLRRQH